MHLTDYDRQQAVHALTQHLTTAKLKSLLPDGVRALVAATEGRSDVRTADELADLLLDLHGAALLSRRDVRLALCKSLDRGTLHLLQEAGNVTANRSRRDAVAEAIANRRWYVGTYWPTYFASTFSFPPSFAGERSEAAIHPYEDVEAYEPLPELYDYQVEACRSVRSLLIAQSDRNRAILTLPTGAGKTRTVVEAIIGALVGGDLHRPVVLWIAQSEELCDQALQAFRQVWLARGQDSIRLYRAWGKHPLPQPYEPAIVIASIQKLYEVVQQARSLADTDEAREDRPDPRRLLRHLQEQLAAMVIDEAHHATAPSYTAVLDELGLGGRRKIWATPLLGLTATPYRSSETEQLTRRFGQKLLVPTSIKSDPVGKLQARGILAHTDHRVITIGGSWTMNEREERHFELFGDFADTFVRRIGEDPERNRQIIQEIATLDPTWPVLFFGCSKEHAVVMAALLRRRGIRAAVVTGETDRAERRALVAAFRAGEIQVLCNYGIFTTGFDAPNVRVVVVARPTTSVVLYEQIVGRGMRGPKNGGTEEVLIMDFSDNLERFGRPMAHTRFQEFWKVRQRA